MSTMPLQNQQQSWDRHVHIPDIPQDIFGNGNANLAQEISELRLEIAALRAELAPVPSLIVTGRQAIDEFKKLSRR